MLAALVCYEKEEKNAPNKNDTNKLTNTYKKFPHSSSHSARDLPRNHWWTIWKLGFDRAAQSTSIVACIDDQELRPSEKSRAIRN